MNTWTKVALAVGAGGIAALLLSTDLGQARDGDVVAGALPVWETDAGCTTFGIGGDLFLTAGHCIKNVNHTKIKFPARLPVSAEVIRYADPMKGDSDFAILRTKESVPHLALPLKCETVPVGTEVTMTGFPSLFGKATVTGTIAADPSPATAIWEQPVYRTNLTSFGGFSGSPVVENKTGEVIGILVGSVTQSPTLTFVTPITDVCDVLETIPVLSPPPETLIANA